MLKKVLSSLLFLLLCFTASTQEKQTKQAFFEKSFKENYGVNVYEQFPTFPKYNSPTFNEQEEIDFEKRCWEWIGNHPEYKEFLISKMNRNAVYNSIGAEPSQTGKGGSGVVVLPKK